MGVGLYTLTWKRDSNLKTVKQNQLGLWTGATGAKGGENSRGLDCLHTQMGGRDRLQDRLI